MVICSVYGCKSRSDRKEAGITFHRFPINNPHKNILWIQRMNIAGWTPTKNNRLCSKHFEGHLFYRIADKTCLLDGAVPTIFPKLPRYLQRRKQLKRETIVSTSHTNPQGGPAYPPKITLQQMSEKCIHSRTGLPFCSMVACKASSELFGHIS